MLEHDWILCAQNIEDSTRNIGTAGLNNCSVIEVCICRKGKSIIKINWMYVCENRSIDTPVSIYLSVIFGITGTLATATYVICAYVNEYYC